MEEVTDDILLARSIEYSAIGKPELFEEKYKTTLKFSDSSVGLLMDSKYLRIVIHVIGGGSLPYKVGPWVLSREAKGNLVTLGLYKKHR
jgi:hypothetical protein